MHVVIIGGGIGGLSAAAALSSSCKKITIYEKDSPPCATHVRRYAPQGAHIHILLQAGLNMLDTLLPGFKEQLIEGGSAEINAGLGQQIFEYGAWRPTRHLDMTYLGQSRLHTESLLYQRISKLHNVDIVKKAVDQVHISATNQVAGVSLRGSSTVEKADIVIDASGASGYFVNALVKQGALEITESKTPINIFYSTIHFKKPSKYIDSKENILIVPEAGVSNLGGSLLDIENDTWCISLHGRDGEDIPDTIEQWQEAIKSLPDSRIWERLRDATPLTEIQYFKKSDAIWRRFDQSESLPLGYLPIGDTINSLNPIFGQGMTVTIGHAMALCETVNECGLKNDMEFSKAYVNRASEWTLKAWKKTTSFDKNFYSKTRKDKKRIDLIRQLTMAQHNKIRESEDYHLTLVRDTQMLT
ncbi:MAG: 2-polyprenyl-6-methoxyphenol hydroxylase-like FAD-dependent oxidoreductase [Flavobacteriales bacterium]|jgi:2-polyprenyl-6-methoxyphenol hydroxylase-like FAD-dependent oxidoreductase